MERVIRPDNLKLFAYTSEEVCSGKVRGLALEFFGLGNQTMYSGPTERAVRLGKRGVILVVPYLNPWAWMDPFAVRTTDEVLDAVRELLGLYQLPVAATGGSMGGHAALLYTAKAKKTPEACVANCPVCDLPYHYTERPDLPRTLYSAFGTCTQNTLEEALAEASPYHLALAGRMPDTRYRIFHCEEDEMVNKQKHSDRLVGVLRSSGRDVEYIAVPGRGHCDLTEEAIGLYEDRICRAF